MQEGNNDRYGITVDDVLLDHKRDGERIPWRERKMASQILADSYRRLGFAKKSFRVRDCGSVLEFKRFEDGALRLKAANFCRDRLCPMCAWRRSLKVFGQVSTVMTAFELLQRYKFLFLTFTVKNVAADGLSDAVDKLNKGFQNLVRRKEIKKILAGGWFRCIEVTHNWERQDFHPHIHAIFVVKRSYFGSVGGYIDHADFMRLWGECCGLDYEPWVDVRAVRQDKEGSYAKAVAEAAKYAVKPGDYLGEAFKLHDPKPPPESGEKAVDFAVGVLSGALHNRRLIAFGGEFKKLHEQLNLDDAMDGDLVNTDNADDVRNDVAFMIVRYGWHVGINHYVRIEKLHGNDHAPMAD